MATQLDVGRPRSVGAQSDLLRIILSQTKLDRTHEMQQFVRADYRKHKLGSVERLSTPAKCTASLTRTTTVAEARGRRIRWGRSNLPAPRGATMRTIRIAPRPLVSLVVMTWLIPWGHG